MTEDDTERLWEALKDIAEQGLTADVQKLIDDGLSPAQIEKALDEVMLPRAFAWARAQYAMVTAAMANAASATKH
jgi:hypothetical protein